MKYIRTTHINNVPKEFSAEAKRAWQESTCNGHLLHPDKALTFEEIVAEHHRYDEQYPEEAHGFTDKQIRRGLELLIKFGMATPVANSPAANTNDNGEN